jgi:hypothetical protein
MPREFPEIASLRSDESNCVCEIARKSRPLARSALLLRFGKWAMVQLGGVEPPTSGSTIRRSNQLSYNCP